MKKSIYDTPIFFERYQLLRHNPISMNEVVEKPTMFGMLPELKGKKVLDLGCGMGEHLAYYLEQGASQIVETSFGYALPHHDNNLGDMQPVVFVHFSPNDNPLDSKSQ